MNKVTVSAILQKLEEIGWSDLIDSRWKNHVISDINLYFEDVPEDILEEVLDIVLV